MLRLAGLGALGLLASSCAGFGADLPASRAPMPLGAGSGLELSDVRVGPPSGLVSLCASGLLACGAATSVEAADTGPTASSGRLSGADRASIFRALLAQRAGSLENAAAHDRTLERVALDQELWALLVGVNAEINWRIAPSSDRAIYGVEERWALPLTGSADGRRRRGDCEDYVLEKRLRLIEAGVPAGALSIATAISPRVGRHAVLLVRTSRGDLVLDNLIENPTPVADVPYIWLALQSGEDLLSWWAAAAPETAQTAGSGKDSLKGRLRFRATI